MTRATLLRHHVAACLAFSFCLGTCTQPGANGRESPRSQSVQRWGYIWSGAALSSSDRERMRTHYTVLSPTGFRFVGSGRLLESRRVPRQMLARLRSSGVRVYPLVSLSSVGAGRRLLLSSVAAARALEALGQLARRYDGIHIDFEYLPPELAPAFARFLRDLRTKLGSKKHLSIAAFPSVEFPQRWSGFHSLRLLGPHVDSVVLMCYDFHRARGPRGPVTDIAWTKKNIEAALKHVAPGRLWLGIPAYGYAWPRAGGRGVVITPRSLKSARIEGLVQKRHTSGTLQVSFRLRGRAYDGYLSDAKTRKQLAALAGRYGLRGTALWRIGFD